MCYLLMWVQLHILLLFKGDLRSTQGPADPGHTFQKQTECERHRPRGFSNSVCIAHATYPTV
jgi:hypothetical protein